MAEMYLTNRCQLLQRRRKQISIEMLKANADEFKESPLKTFFISTKMSRLKKIILERFN